MTTLFTESPGVMYVLTGMGITGILVVIYTQNRNPVIRIMIGVAAFITLLPVVTSWFIETDREQITRQIFRMANCVRQNDVDGLLRFVDPDSRDTLDKFSREMPGYNFSACNVTGFQKLEVDPVNANQAIARFSVFVNVSAPQIGHEGPAIRGVELRFRQQADGRWLVTGFRHFPTAFMQRLLDSR